MELQVNTVEEVIVPNASTLNGKPLFSFVVVADTHVNEDDGISSSPFHTNALANERARHVFLDIAAMDPQPKFVVHLGDIVHPVPSLPTFGDAVQCFKDIAAPVKVPVHLVPGNHDVGDKHVDWMPADRVCDAFLKSYREAFGPDYAAFDEGNLRFIMMNSLLLNSGLPDEEVQKRWLLQQVDEAHDKRVFLFMHYPPYIHSANERGNYDNVDEPGRSWLLELMRKPQVEAAFAGHVHNFWYDRVGDAELYMLPSTAFLRHDFTEFYRTAPGAEFGRGDVDKFGYFVVDVYSDGHVAHSVRTHGARASRGTEAITAPERFLAHPKTSTFDNVGVELRHPWAETMQITATGGVQEFGRKWARNDYPLLALWEMGARLSKVPDLDLSEDEPRRRMELLARMGHRYVVTTVGVPKPGLVDHDLSACGVAAFEVNITAEQFERRRDALRGLRKATGSQIYYSKILTADPSHYDGKHFSHFVNAGFVLEELEPRRKLIADAVSSGAIDGITVRIEPQQCLHRAARQLMQFSEETGCLILASIKLSGPSLAAERADDRANVASLAQAMVLSKASNNIRYIYDTFMDVDRGYFPRHAFIDRHFNPRDMAKAYTVLTSLFSSADPFVLQAPTPDEAGTLAFTVQGRRHDLVMLESMAMLTRLRALPSTTMVHDLASGEACTAGGLIDCYEHLLTSDKQTLQVVLITLD